jgi:hypothetical protein
MVDPQHLALLQQDIAAWNRWREEAAEAQPDLSDSSLTQANLLQADLHGARLQRADLRDANLEGADLREADLRHTDLRGARLSQANLEGANFSHANLSLADLRNANLIGSYLVKTNLDGAKLEGCSVYGVAVWEVSLRDADQANLVVTRPEEYPIMVDDIRIAQLTHLLLNAQEIKPVIDTLTENIVLILGRFSTRRKKILDALQHELRGLKYLPIYYDFESPRRRNTTETLSTLVHLARFVVADLTEGRTALRLQTIVPEVAVPVQTLLDISDTSKEKLEDHRIAFTDIARYPWVLPIVEYVTPDDLVELLGEKIIRPAEEKVKELEKVRAGI